jgi:hypothetical protein
VRGTDLADNAVKTALIHQEEAMKARKWRGSVLLAGIAAFAYTPASSLALVNASRGSAAAPELRTAMRKLWSDHVIWTRQYIVSAALGDPSAQAASKRLLKNQEDIGNAIVPFYGSAAGAKLTSLLKQHILIAVDLVAAAKAGNATKQADADKRWHNNAADIATFLSGANPNWKRQALLDMLNQHLALTTREAVDRLKKNWTDDVSAFDGIYNQAMMMADALTDGIARQYPAKVK